MYPCRDVLQGKCRWYGVRRPHVLPDTRVGKNRKALGGFYAFGILFGCLGIGNMFQSNQAYSQFLVVIGGIKSIARVASKLVPFMAVLYILTALVVIFMNGKYIPAAISMILDGAFNGKALGGGMLGAIVVGFQRAVFSNEAGLGSAAIAHSAVQTKEPITEGFVSILEPTLDTLIVLAITSLVITTSMDVDPIFASNLLGNTLTGMAASSAAFTAHFPFVKYLLSAAGMLFALSTALGSSIQLGSLMDISDALVFLICVPNVLGLFMLAPMVKTELNIYWEKIKTGEIRPTVTNSDLSKAEA